MNRATAFVITLAIVATSCATPPADDNNAAAASRGRRIRAIPIEPTDPTDPQDDQGESPGVGCPDPNAQFPGDGAGLRVFARSEARVVATYCGAESAFINDVSLSSPSVQPIATGHITEAGTTVDLGVFVSGDE